MCKFNLSKISELYSYKPNLCFIVRTTAWQESQTYTIDDSRGLPPQHKLVILSMHTTAETALQESQTYTRNNSRKLPPQHKLVYSHYTPQLNSTEQCELSIPFSLELCTPKVTEDMQPDMYSETNSQIEPISLE